MVDQQQIQSLVQELQMVRGQIQSLTSQLNEISLTIEALASQDPDRSVYRALGGILLEVDDRASLTRSSARVKPKSELSTPKRLNLWMIEGFDATRYDSAH